MTEPVHPFAQQHHHENAPPRRYVVEDHAARAFQLVEIAEAVRHASILTKRYVLTRSKIKDYEEGMILVTASTGKLGHHVIKHLLHRVPASQIVAGVRNRQKAKEFSDKGIELRELDYSKPASIAEAMTQQNLPPGNPGRFNGSYCTIWSKQADGTWKVVFDIGRPAD